MRIRLTSLALALAALGGCVTADDGSDPVACECDPLDTGDTGDNSDTSDTSDTADTADSATTPSL